MKKVVTSFFLLYVIGYLGLHVSCQVDFSVVGNQTITPLTRNIFPSDIWSFVNTFQDTNGDYYFAGFRSSVNFSENFVIHLESFSSNLESHFFSSPAEISGKGGFLRNDKLYFPYTDSVSSTNISLGIFEVSTNNITNWTSLIPELSIPENPARPFLEDFGNTIALLNLGVLGATTRLSVYQIFETPTVLVNLKDDLEVATFPATFQTLNVDQEDQSIVFTLSSDFSVVGRIPHSFNNTNELAVNSTEFQFGDTLRTESFGLVGKFPNEDDTLLLVKYRFEDEFPELLKVQFLSNGTFTVLDTLILDAQIASDAAHLEVPTLFSEEERVVWIPSVGSSTLLIAVDLDSFAVFRTISLNASFSEIHDLHYSESDEMVMIFSSDSTNTILTYFSLPKPWCPLRCNRKCVTDLSFCISLACKDFECVNGDCVASPSECENIVCPNGQFSCWDGSCEASLQNCPAVSACLGRARCANGSCASSIGECQPAICSNITCADGSCVNDELACPEFNGCPVGFFECFNGQCTQEISDCQCPTNSTDFLCWNGGCASSGLCLLPPSSIKPIPLEVFIQTQRDNSFQISSTEGELIANISIPRETFGQCGEAVSLTINPVSDSILREITSSQWSSGDSFSNLLSPTFEITLNGCPSDFHFFPESIDIQIFVAKDVVQSIVDQVPEGSRFCLFFAQNSSNNWECLEERKLDELSLTENQLVVSGRTNHFTKFSFGLSERGEDDENDAFVIHIGVVIAIIAIVLLLIVGLIVSIVFFYRKGKKTEYLIEVANEDDPRYNEIKALLEEEQLMAYFPYFVRHQIDYDILRRLDSNKLVEIGIPLGTAKRILKRFETFEANIYIPENEIQIKREIGGGAFGKVYEGRWQSNVVALKCLTDLNQTDEFFAEVKILKGLKNPNIVYFYGLYKPSGDDIQYIVTEFLRLGNLKDFLPKMKEKLDIRHLVHIAKSAASGMVYLYQNKIIHCDLAARNLLVKLDEGYYTVKVADFGLSKHTKDYKYQAEKDSMFPVKWTAIEAFGGHFSSKSDVWSYGVTLYEIITYGKNPYQGMNNSQVFSAVKEGYRMPKPDDCPESIYRLMSRCWKEDPDDRPNFNQVYDQLVEIQGEVGRVEAVQNSLAAYPSQLSLEMEEPKKEPVQEDNYAMTPGSKPAAPSEPSHEYASMDENDGSKDEGEKYEKM